MESALPPSARPDPYGGRGPEMLALMWTLMAVTTVLLGLRIVNLMKLVRNAGVLPLFYGWMSWGFATLSTCFFTLSVLNGLGNHIETVMEAGTISPVIKWEWTANSMAGLAIGVGKFAVVSFYVDIQGPVYVWRSRCLWALAASNLLLNFVLLWLMFFQCSPPAHLWDASIEGTCSLSKVVTDYGIAGGAWNAMTDFILAFYPATFVWGLKISTKVKLGLCSLMGVGIFAAVCSTMKTYLFRDADQEEDVTYEVATLLMWGVAEMWVILITASIPPLWPLFKWTGNQVRQLSQQKSWTSRSSASGSRGSEQSDSEAKSRLADSSGASSRDYPSSRGSDEDPEAYGLKQLPIVVQKTFHSEYSNAGHQDTAVYSQAHAGIPDWR